MCSLLLSCASYGEGIDTAAAPIPSEWRGLDTQYASQLLSTFLACRCLLCLQGILLYGIFFGRTGCEAQCWLAVSRDSLVFSYHRDTVGRCWPVWPSAASALFHLQVVTQNLDCCAVGRRLLGRVPHLELREWHLHILADVVQTRHRWHVMPDTISNCC